MIQRIANDQAQQRQGQWQRSNTYSGSIPPKPQPPRPPISVSAKTKSKLQQFQFQKTGSEESSSLPHLTEFPNKVTEADANSTEHDTNKENRVSSDPTLTNASVVTPASRLAWQDLMGAEDADKQHKDKTSPEERLQWHIEDGHAAADTSPLLPRRRKKRARSSSPISSPAVNVKNLKQAMDSPRADPALDLWDRFAVGAPDSKNPLGATNPALAHLMVSSSPRASKDALPSSSGNSLRRAISCGTHWPKRRRIEAMAEAGPAKERAQTSKSSMVTALLETVNGDINKSDELEEAEIGLESPSFKKCRSPNKSPAFPILPPTSQQLPQAGVVAVETGSENLQDLQDAKTPSSDYGDDDFDEDDMWELDASLLSGQVETISSTAVERAVASGPVKEPEKKQDGLDQDEFDDVDDDLLAAAAQDTLAEENFSPDTKAKLSISTKAIYLDGGTDDAEDTYEDEFGGDFDFEAVELAATQSVGQKASSLMPVRTV